MTDYRFGWFERIGLSVVLLVVWAVIAATAMAVIGQHGDDPAGFNQAIRYSNGLMGLSLAIFLLGRPIVTSLPDAYKTVKETVA